MTEPRFATKVAQELNTPTTAEKNEPPAQFDEKEAGRGAPMPAIYRTKKSGLGSFLLFVCILLCAAVARLCIPDDASVCALSGPLRSPCL